MKPLKIALLGEGVLKNIARPLDIPNELPFALNLSQKMLALLDSLGERIGLAAPQVFESVRLFVYRIPASIHPRYKTKTDSVPITTMINPEWKPLSDEIKDGWEACISVPGLMGMVPRHTSILCTYTNLSGNKVELHANGFHAMVLQHEIDHLNGIVFIERMKNLSTLGFEDVFLKKQLVDVSEVA